MTENNKFLDFLKTLSTEESKTPSVYDLNFDSKPLTTDDAEKLNAMLDGYLKDISETASKQFNLADNEAKAAKAEADKSRRMSVFSSVLSFLSLIVAIISTIIAAKAAGYL